MTWLRSARSRCRPALVAEQGQRCHRRGPGHRRPACRAGPDPQVTVGPDYTAGANPPGYVPPHLHGTYIGSIIACDGSGPGGAQWMIGVAPQAKILSVRVIYPGITPAQVARALAESASYHPAGGYNTTVGFGLINPRAPSMTPRAGQARH